MAIISSYVIFNVLDKPINYCTYIIFVPRIIPSMLRECVYSGFRIGAYEPMKVFLGATDPAHTPVYKKLTAGAVSGNPMDSLHLI